MNTNIKRQMTKTIEKMTEDAIQEIKSNSEEDRKKKKLYAKFLKLIKPMIIEMLRDGYEIKMTNKIINDTFGIEINYITFFRWVKRNITIKEIEENTKKSNVKEKKVSHKAPVPKKTKSVKEVQNGNVKTIIEEVKSTGEEEDFDRNAGKTGFLDDI